jgi:hypothetical protein
MIITQLNGGLGNQMFQYAMGRTLAVHHNTELKLDMTQFNNQGELPQDSIGISHTPGGRELPLRASYSPFTDICMLSIEVLTGFYTRIQVPKTYLIYALHKIEPGYPIFIVP